MNSRRILLLVCAAIAAVGAVFFFLSIVAQAMLGGVSDREVYFDRMVAWLVYFPVAGLLAMAAVYLFGHARRGDSLPVKSKPDVRRGVLLPLGWFALAGCIYFADFASYLGRHPSGSLIGSFPEARIYEVAAIGLLIAAVLSFAWARKKFS